MARLSKTPTDRSFGLTFTVVFTIVGAWLWYRSSRYFPYLFGAAGVFAVATLLAPRILHPLNVAWMHFGALLNRIVSPIVLGAIFVVVFVPVGLFFRLTGRDALRRSFEPALTSYWIERTPPGPPPQSFPRQF
ncbi:MAG TPA: SxtJ family membrane protein [Steroidobacter sp.]|jgi:hypothetical protein